MSHEISWRHTDTGVTLYVTIRSTARTYWNGADLEALTVANWGDYDVALSETPASSYFYVGTFPAGAAVGFYWLDVFVQAGASPAISDTLTGTMIGYWDAMTFQPYAPNAAEIADAVDARLSDEHGENSWEVSEVFAWDVANAVWDELLADHTTSGSAGAALSSAGGSAGSGAITFTYTLTSTEDSAPIAGADVWATTDAGGTNVVASGVTNASGAVVFYLDAGTYYIWRQLAGWNFTNPDTEVVA